MITALFLNKPPISLSLWMVGEKEKSNLKEGKSVWFQRMGVGSASAGDLPKFVVLILGTVPFGRSAGGFGRKNRTSKQNSDQPAEYTTSSISFSFPFSLVYLFLHNLEKVNRPVIL
jgi:hypothetical protein